MRGEFIDQHVHLKLVGIFTIFINFASWRQLKRTESGRQAGADKLLSSCCGGPGQRRLLSPPGWTFHGHGAACLSWFTTAKSHSICRFGVANGFLVMRAFFQASFDEAFFA